MPVASRAARSPAAAAGSISQPSQRGPSPVHAPKYSVSFFSG